ISVMYVLLFIYVFILFFFFQAEDGIRDLTVTGVQTCALPIYPVAKGFATHDLTIWLDQARLNRDRLFNSYWIHQNVSKDLNGIRSEERRVGKECRSRWWAEH